MNAPNWLDSLLWSISRAYRRRKIRQSRVYSEPLAPARPNVEALDRALERPAILPYPVPREHPEYPRHKSAWAAVGVDIERLAILARGRASDRRSLGTRELLVEKLTDEAMMHGSWPIGREYYCEHCPQYGYCSICGQDHVGGGAA